MAGVKHRIVAQEELNPAEVSEVTRLFTERQNENRVADEAMKAVPTVADVAQALGTTPEQVADLLHEVRGNEAEEEEYVPYEEAPIEEEPPAIVSVPAKASNASGTGGVIALAVALPVLFIFILALGQSSSSHSRTWSSSPGFPYQSYTREQIQSSVRSWPVVRLPDRLQIAGIRYVVDNDSAFANGVESKDTPAVQGSEATERMKAAIRWLLEVAEGRYKEKQDGYRAAMNPFSVTRKRYMSMENEKGRHTLWISAYGWSSAVELPYIGSSGQSAKAELDRRLELLCDMKFLDGVGPGGLRPKAQRIRTGAPLGPGMAIVADNGTAQVWDGGPAATRTAHDYEKVDTYLAIHEFVAKISQRPEFKRSPDVSIRLIYPGGEVTADHLPLANGDTQAKMIEDLGRNFMP